MVPMAIHKTRDYFHWDASSFLAGDCLFKENDKIGKTGYFLALG